MKKQSQTLPQTFSNIMARVLKNGRSTMSAAAARQILKLGFDQADRKRLADLRERNGEGNLSAEERDELMEFVRVGNFLAIIQSQARMALKRAGKAKV